jgi:GT2 family glycosyltransferase
VTDVGIAVGIVASRSPDSLKRSLGAVLQQVTRIDSVWVTLLEEISGAPECAVRVNEAAAAHDDSLSVVTLAADRSNGLGLFESPAQARNAVIEACGEEIAVFLDDGGTPVAGWLRAIRDSFSDPGVDAIAGRIVVPGLDVNQSDPPGGRLRWTGYLQLNFSSDTPGASTLASGRNCAVRRSLALGLQGFDEAFTAGLPYEDVEFFTRIGKAGGRTRYLPEATVELEPEEKTGESVDIHLENLEAQAARTCAMAAIFARHEVWALLIMSASHLIQAVLDVFIGRLPNYAPLRILTEIGEGVRMGVRPVESRIRPRKRRRR